MNTGIFLAFALVSTYVSWITGAVFIHKITGSMLIAVGCWVILTIASIPPTRRIIQIFRTAR